MGTSLLSNRSKRNIYVQFLTIDVTFLHVLVNVNTFCLHSILQWACSSPSHEPALHCLRVLAAHLGEILSILDGGGTLITPVMLPLCTIHYVYTWKLMYILLYRFAMNNLLWYNYVNFKTDVERRVGVAVSVLRWVLCISALCDKPRT